MTLFFIDGHWKFHYSLFNFVFSRQKKSFNVSVDITCQTTSVFIFFYLENYHFSVIDDCTIKKKKFAESSYACSSLSSVYRIS